MVVNEKGRSRSRFEGEPGLAKAKAKKRVLLRQVSTCRGLEIRPGLSGQSFQSRQCGTALRKEERDCIQFDKIRVLRPNTTHFLILMVANNPLRIGGGVEIGTSFFHCSREEGRRRTKAHDISSRQI